MSKIDKIKFPIKQEMKEFDRFFKSSLKSKVPLVDIITNYILRRKGKRLRPMFVFLSAKMLGEINEASYTAASLIELLHTATLIHDDVVDESYERRGFFSINALWKSKIAVLLGDYLLSKGLLLALEKKEFEVLEIVAEAVREISEGELFQIQKSRKLDISETEYFEIIRKKTATLIAACTATGAKSIGAAQETISNMKDFGKHAGIAFQIRDDLFDYQKNGLVGKPRGNDIKEKKLTLPLIYSLEKASRKKRKHILRLIVRQGKSSGYLEEIIRFVEDSGGIDYSIQKMHEYKNIALESISSYPENESKLALIELVNYSIDRKK
ncbi:MAG: polyprenyl synthetase family protein [Bacteroidota bacterium]|nr:polyprenyl synthetase family protein [Bacteroidota bacterium]